MSVYVTINRICAKSKCLPVTVLWILKYITKQEGLADHILPHLIMGVDELLISVRF